MRIYVAKQPEKAFEISFKTAIQKSFQLKKNKKKNTNIFLIIL